MEHRRHNVRSCTQDKSWLCDFRRRVYISLDMLLRIQGGNGGIELPFKGNSTAGDNGGKLKGQRYSLKEGKKIT